MFKLMFMIFEKNIPLSNYISIGIFFEKNSQV